MHASRHMHADRLTRFLLDLLEEVDRVGLQNGHVRIGVQRVKAARRMPGRPRGQDGALDQGDVGPAQLGKMVNDGGADDAPSDHRNPIVRLHAVSCKTCAGERLTR